MPPAESALPEPVAAGFRDGLFALPEPPSGLAVSQVRPVWRVPVILVSYADDSLQYHAPEFDFELFDSTGSTPTGSVYDYYQSVSRGRLTVRGQVVATVRVLNGRAFYGYSSYGLNRLATPFNAAGLVHDALDLADSQVHWFDYDADQDGYVDMLWVVHAGIGGEALRDVNDLWSITSTLEGAWSASTAYESPQLIPGSLTRHMRVNRFSILPELSSVVPGGRAEIGVFCHEFGHALGLPDLYNTLDRGTRNVGPGHWSLMATGGSGGDGHSPEYPVRLGAWEMLFLGWGDLIRPAFDTTLVLPPTGQGPAASILDLAFQGEPTSDHFLVEDRRREGFDRNLPGEGLIVYHIDEAVIGQGLAANAINTGPSPGLKVVEADGHSDLTLGNDRGGPEDPFPGLLNRTLLWDEFVEPSTRSYRGLVTNIGLFGITPVTDGVRFTAQVRAPGWAPPADRTETGYQPAGASGSTITTGIGPGGALYRVASEIRSGHAQIVLRVREGDGWAPGFVVSHSGTNAIEPSLAVLEGGDLAIVWSDTRLGTAQLFYRARVRGVWIDEQAIGEGGGESRSPALAADLHGAMHLTWLSVQANHPRLMFMRFSYLSPYGQPVALTSATAVPSNPAIATDPDGGSYVMWSEHSLNPPTLMFLHYSPDSLLHPAQRLGNFTALTQASVQCTVDANGNLYSVWLATGPGESEIHYQRRLASGGSSPRDTIIEHRGGTIRDVRAAVDAQGGVHVVFENSASGVDELRYRRWHPIRGWDSGSTQITGPLTASSASAFLFADSPGNVTVAYDLFDASGTHFIERRRISDVPAGLDAPPPSAAPRLALSVGPNPLHAGGSLWLSAPRSHAETADFFDVTGRRLASIALDRDPAGARGRVDGSVTAGWSAGIYFARLREPGGAATRLVVLR